MPHKMRRKNRTKMTTEELTAELNKIRADLKTLIALVQKMRGEQQKFFQTRINAYLVSSKELERQVDNETKRLNEDYNFVPKQQKLF